MTYFLKFGNPRMSPKRVKVDISNLTQAYISTRLLTKNNWQDRKKREIAIIENNKIQQILL